MKTIPLSQGKVALVDDEDFERINQFKWCAAKNCNAYYAVRNTYNPKIRIIMHRVILNAKKGDEIDHRNGNGLDNRKDNLRFCTPSQNHQNRRLMKGGTSKYKGVDWFKREKKWRSKIVVNKKAIYLGLFDSEIEAACVYDTAASRYFGEFARFNFSENNTGRKVANY